MNESTDPHPLSIRILTPGLAPEEIAAVTAVIEAAVEEELGVLRGEVVTGPSAWERSQRALREPLHPGPGAWRSFAR